MNKLGRYANSPWMSMQRVKGVTVSVAELTFTLVLSCTTIHTHTHTPHIQQAGTSLVWQDLTGFTGDTHAHVPTVQENAQKHLQTCTPSRLYHLYTKFAHSCGYRRLRSCPFERARVARHLCRRFQSKIVCSKLFHATGTCQTLAYAIVGDQVTFPWQRCKGSHWTRRRDQDSNQWHGFRENITH